MADEEDPWGAGDDEPEVTAPTIDAPKSGDATVQPENQSEAVSAPVTEESVPQDEVAPPPPPPEDDGYRKPVQLYKHWVRPKFLQYRYMYNYRTNYYDDVIDYLDKKQSGVNREIPRPQTWAERVLRANTGSGRSFDSYSSSHKEDSRLIQTLAASIKTHNYHTKAYINQKYSHVL